MTREQFQQIRTVLAKTQKQMAQILGVSVKAVQSFEQGWRNIPVHVERQALFLFALARTRGKRALPCWSVAKCLPAHRKACPAWEFRLGNLCWFINGTVCRGTVQRRWREKIELCRKCQVFRRQMQGLVGV